METNKLIFSNRYKFEIGSNIFINVPVILRYEDIDLISVIKETELEYTTKIPIFHSDGTHLAYAKGNRLYTTPDGDKAGLEIKTYPSLWVGKMDGKTIFEIKQKAPDFFKTTAELYTNDGFFVKCLDNPSPVLINTNGDSLRIGGIVMSGNTFTNCKTGVWIRKNGSVGIG